MTDKFIEPFWLDDYKVLYKNNNYIRFVPKASMTKIQQLNAITRFSIYCFVLILLFEEEIRWLYVPIFFIILCIILFKLNKIDLLQRENYRNTFDYDEKIDNRNTFDYDEKIDNRNTFDYDEKIDNRNTFDYDEKIECVKPTQNNPYMNFLLTDYTENPDRPIACNTAAETEEELYEVNRDIDLYRDVDDLFEKKNSQRQFYTMPSTSNPNDQKAFAEWLYGVPETCKTDQTYCLRYDKLKQASRPL